MAGRKGEQPETGAAEEKGDGADPGVISIDIPSAYVIEEQSKEISRLSNEVVMLRAQVRTMGEWIRERS